MDFSDYFPIWNKLTAQQQKTLSQSAGRRTVQKGTVIHNGSMDCLGYFCMNPFVPHTV